MTCHVVGIEVYIFPSDSKKHTRIGKSSLPLVQSDSPPARFLYSHTSVRKSITHLMSVSLTIPACTEISKNGIGTPFSDRSSSPVCSQIEQVLWNKFFGIDFSCKSARKYIALPLSSPRDPELSGQTSDRSKMAC